MSAVRATSRLTLSACVLATALVLVGCTAAVPSRSSQPAATDTRTTPATVTATPAPIAASVVIAGVDTDGQHVSVSGFVSGVSENGGACTFVMTPAGGGAPVTLTRQGIENVSTTSCGTNQSPIANFSRGTWSVVLKYASAKASVTSAAIEMEIP